MIGTPPPFVELVPFWLNRLLLLKRSDEDYDELSKLLFCEGNFASLGCSSNTVLALSRSLCVFINVVLLLK